MKTVKKAQKGKTVKPTYDRLGLARSANNKSMGRDTNTPATARDSANYRSGFSAGLKGKKPSALQMKYEGEDQYFQKGRWEGQNVNKKDSTVKKSKVGTTISKAKKGTAVKKSVAKCKYGCK
jgi:hypothetical protein